MDKLTQDLRYTLRGLINRPGFAVAAVLSLGLGIGANTAIFSLIDSTLLRPLAGLRDADRIVAVYTSTETRPFSSASYADFIDYRERQSALTGLAAHAVMIFNMGTGGEPARTQGAIVSANYFNLLDVRPQLGRVFLAEEDRTPGTHPVVIISDGLWRTTFGADPDVIGKALTLNAIPFTIVGVAPRGFRGLDLADAPDVWIPLMMVQEVVSGFFAQFDLVDYDAQRHSERRMAWLDLVGRLRKDVSVQQAGEAMTAVAQSLKQAYPESYRGTAMTVVPASVDAGRLRTRGDLVRFLALLLGVVGLTLLISCANVANLLLARVADRRREISVRLALGAARPRVIRQLMTESLLLAILGGLAGVLLAAWMLDVLTAYQLPGDIPIETLNLSLSGRVLAVALTLSLLTGLVFGSLPALQASMSELTEALKDQGRSFARRRSTLRGLRDPLIALQVALSLLLLIGAGLFLRSLRNGLNTDLGYNPDRVLLTSMELGLQGYDEERAEAFYRELLRRVESLPGVSSASLTSAPFGRRAFGVTSIFVEGAEALPGERDVRKHLNFVGPRYGETLGLRLLSGRDLAEIDFAEGTQPTAVVSEAMARRYWPDQNAIGKRFRFAPNGNYFEIVGVVEDTKYESLRDRGGFMYVYLPGAFSRVDEMTLAVRAEGDSRQLVDPIRREIQALDANLPVFDVATVSDRMKALLMPQRMGSTLLGLFSALALLLAGVGIYGVIAYAVSQRTREIGIRIALGAERSHVLVHVVGQSAVPLLVGLALGLAGAFVLSRFVRAFLYGVDPTDLVTFAATPIVMVIVALCAAYVPARRAVTVDPTAALRQE